MTKINLDVKEADYVKVGQIAGRAVDLGLIEREMIVDAALDIVVCHLNARPLDLQAFVDSGEKDFQHDFLGIRRLISLRTGRLGEHWTPRCARKEAA